jgi:2-(1,2-epoxy-1,2-dihydrophenyl)acetyl-CoA isomerase
LAVPFSHIDLTFRENVATLTLNRPEKLNSLDADAMSEINQAMAMVEKNNDARVLVLTGSGRAFCAGQDLADPSMQIVNGHSPDIGTIVERRFNPLVMRLQALNIPTIAAVNGLAAGGGMALALACDLVMAAKSAYFVLAFSRIGLTPDTGSSWSLVRRVGVARAMGLAYLSDKLPAAKAEEWGLILKAVDDAEFVAELDRLAMRVAEMPTTVLVRTRQLMHAACGHTLEQQLSMESTYIREMGRSRDYVEGVKAFHEKRQPNFLRR